MSAQENETLVRRFLEDAYNEGNLAVGDELLTADCVFWCSHCHQGYCRMEAVCHRIPHSLS